MDQPRDSSHLGPQQRPAPHPDGLADLLRDVRLFAPLLTDVIDPAAVEYFRAAAPSRKEQVRTPARRAWLKGAARVSIGASVGLTGYLVRSIVRLQSDQVQSDSKRLLNDPTFRWVEFHRLSTDRDLTVYFTTLMTHRGVLSEIRYGVDTEKLSRTFAFPDYSGSGVAPTTADVPILLSVPITTRFVTVQLIFKDHTVSAVRRFNVPADPTQYQ